MKRDRRPRGKRGTTLIEVLVAVALMTLIFIFITAELIQSSQAENLASDHSQSIEAANYLLGVVKGDPTFWSGGSNDWASGPQNGAATDSCGVAYPPYTDSITAPTWHPLCPNVFPELKGATETVGNGVNAQYMWNVQTQGGDKYVAQITLWVMTDEGGRNDLYELHATRMNTAPTPAWSPSLPPASPSPSPSPSSSSKTPTPTPSPSPTPSATGKGSPTPKPSPTPTPSKTPKPSPTPTGIFE